MADLIAIGYPDETTAEAAADEARQLARDLIIEPDAIAVIERDARGDYHVHTHHHLIGRGATWGMWWGLLFGVLFFIPVLGIAIRAGLVALGGQVTKSGGSVLNTSLSKEGEHNLQDALHGTSAA